MVTNIRSALSTFISNFSIGNFSKAPMDFFNLCYQCTIEYRSKNAFVKEWRGWVVMSEICPDDLVYTLNKETFVYLYFVSMALRIYC